MKMHIGAFAVGALAFAGLANAGGGLIISEIVDGSLSGGLPKFVEITNTSNAPVDLSGFSLGNINNGAATMGFDALVLSGTLAPGDSYVVSYENNDEPGVGTFFNVYGFDPDNFAQGSFINGDDVLVLFQGAALAGDPADGSGQPVVDAYGVVGVNGDGEVWDYTDGYSFRNADGSIANGGAFDAPNWTFGGLNSLAGADEAEEVALLLALTTPGVHEFDGGTGNDAVFYLHLLHNNDGESQLINAPELPDFGGVARFATLAAQLRAEADALTPAGVNNGSLLITAGDNFLAGPEFQASLNDGVFYDAIAMQLIGYDGFGIGNHEFDFGPQLLADFINSFTNGATFLSANLDFSTEPTLAALVGDGLAASQVFEVSGVQVGVIGATTENLPFISSPGGVVVNPVVAAVNAEAQALTDAGVNIIVLSSHLQGIVEELSIADQLSNVDVIVGGGGDQLLANEGDLLIPGDSPAIVDFNGQMLSGYPLMAQGFDGGDIPVVTSDGNYKYIGRLIVGFDADGNVVDILPESGPVRVSGVGDDAVVEDPTVLEMVTNPVAASIDALDEIVVATSDVELDGIRDNVRSIETNQGNLCADSILWLARQNAGDFGVPQPTIGFQNGGGIRNDSLIAPGPLSVLDTFDIFPFLNFVTVVEGVTAERLLLVLENAVSRVGGADGTGRFAQVSGISFTWDPAGTALEFDGEGNVLVPGTRVQDVMLYDGTLIVDDGAVVEGAPVFNIAIVDFNAGGGDEYPLADLPRTIVGSSYQQALADYLSIGLSGSVTSIGYPEGGEGRIINLETGGNFCATDLNHDGSTGSQDLNLILGAFGTSNPDADINGDFVVNSVDLNLLLGAFGDSCE